ncbi:hypothetical protein WJX75_008348 [Coccomyxa subellipsoidea]|uniref:Uncharacterized protein n=1 Tax=Coccomyxa subellipsoidea TaxID=248742 RepID=A0ABR2YBB7_9CHLO
MEAVDVLGCLEGGLVFYRIIGKQGIDYDLRILVTDFQGRSWRASFALQDVFDALDAYEPEEQELLHWIISCLDQPRKSPTLLKGPELAGALFAAYRKERSAAATASIERNELKQEVDHLQATCEKLQDRLHELNPAGS